MTTFVVSIGNGSKSLLASCVPNLQFNISIIRFDSFEPKVNSNSGHVVLIELIVSESKKQAWLAHSWITNNDIFEKIIVLTISTCHNEINLIIKYRIRSILKKGKYYYFVSFNSEKLNWVSENDKEYYFWNRNEIETKIKFYHNIYWWDSQAKISLRNILIPFISERKIWKSRSIIFWMDKMFNTKSQRPQPSLILKKWGLAANKFCNSKNYLVLNQKRKEKLFSREWKS